MDEGYGLSTEGIARCIDTFTHSSSSRSTAALHPSAEIASLREKNAEVLVFDHHEIKGALPDCTLVNPKLGDALHNLCTVGIVFKACHALLKTRPVAGFDLREHLDIVALGTVADIVPLTGENRLLVQKGLQQMERTRWAGLRALMDIAAVRAPIRPGDVGFRLGPRLNAAGRLGTAEDALRLLLSEDLSEARTLAVSLDRQNQERQLVEQRMLRAAEAMVASSFDPERDAAIVIGETGWHPGVLGIIASRISKSFHRPTFVIGFDEAGIGKGSGRSIEGLSLVRALGDCGALLEKFGGHEMAAGLTIQRDRFADFQRAFLDCARRLLTDGDLQPRLRLDAEVQLDELDFDFLDHHDLLQPFGVGNPQPVFFTRGVSPAAEPRVLKEKHLSLSLRQNGENCSAIYFGGAENELPRPPWDIAFRVERNEFRERVSVQVQVVAVREAMTKSE